MLTTEEVKKTLKLVDACELKSRRFITKVKKLGFAKAYEDLTNEIWEHDTQLYNDRIWERQDLFYPISDLLERVSGKDFPSMLVEMRAIKTSKAFLRRYSAKRLATLAKRLIKKTEE